MTDRFDHGYALLIGVDENRVTRYALPDVAKDIDALSKVLVHPERCAYAAENVKVLTGPAATRTDILDGLDWLASRLKADTDGNTTAVIYYSGHGWRDEDGSTPTYYLVPFDLRSTARAATSLRAEDFSAAIGALDPRRLLVVLDCCHSGGMGIKDAADDDFVSVAIPPSLLMGSEKAVATGAKGVEALARGQGRAVLSSSQGSQPSHMRQDGRMSIFTYHLIEALTGHAQPEAGAAEVLVSDVMGHVSRRVPLSARADWGVDQEPDYQVSGNFPITLVMGGKGVGKGAMPPDPLDPLPATPPVISQSMTGPGVQVGRDQTIHGDLVLGNKIGRQVNTGGGAYVKGDFSSAGTGNMIAGGDVTLIGDQAAERFLGRLKLPLSVEALRQATKVYFQALLDRHRYLGLKGMGVTDRIPLKLPLLELYVPLKARRELPEGETWQRDLMLAGRDLAAARGDAPAVRMSGPAPVIDLLRSHDILIILGDPGAGKTTFLKFLALRLALGQGADLGLGERFPVLVPLSAYANALSERDVPLDEFISQYFHDLGADLPLAQMLDAALDAGAALVLLDGLDEVKDLALRHTVVERVTDFCTFCRRKGNKFVLTSRVVGYRAVRPTAEGLVECTLVDFDVDEISAFVSRWTAALERQALGDTPTARADADRERRELLDAIQRNPGVRRLAANPLLLTILALMKRQGVTLPERRVELYDQYVTTLLSSWNRVRGLGRPSSHELDVVQTLRVLAPLALWMHEVNPGVGLVKREDLRRKLAAIFAESGDPDAGRAAKQFLDDVHEHAGLLLERGPEEYGFIHLTFEEYLAAVAIALEGQGDCRPIVDRLSGHVGDPAWREVALLTIGYLGIRQQLPKVAGDVVEALIEGRPGAPGEAVVLAGEAVLDAMPAGVPPESKTKVIDALILTMQGSAIPAALRRRAGLLLGSLGWVPPDLEDFVEVPAGKFLYGDDKREREIPYCYWISKYPVTNRQFARFVEAGGYDREEFWSHDGWRWRTGTNSARTNKRNRPLGWNDRDDANPIFPVVGVTWFEAEAYTNWLSKESLIVRSDQAIPGGYCVRLATEEEWEYASRGADGREYPWGEACDSSHCNSTESRAAGGSEGSTTAACTYPHGTSPFGIWDMSGNIWEWTCSRKEEDTKQHVVCGGSWLMSLRGTRCAYRSWDLPDYSDTNLGLRVVVSLSNSAI